AVNNLYSVVFTNANIGTIVGSDGIILRTTDGGTNWTKQTSGTTNHLNGVSFTDVNTGTAVGSAGTILRTTDGGASWTSQTSGTTNELRSVSFTDANTGTAVGFGGTILRTTDGGLNWTNQTSKTSNHLSGVSFTDASTGTAVGSGGTILRTTTGGVTWVEDKKRGEIPQEYTLSQNYPNPFNPTTTIGFRTQVSGFTSLKVYDVLGKEIATLVNEQMSAGNYSATWNAQNVSSGMYFYRLHSGNVVETKRMLLLK
ncbi:MAG: T9SS type A sorting domain-containing protein, partial [Ignavibacteriales bacterium]|nr:T9SS type A sorting domain-containing protein [Ignavibacteriales bacterium]